MLLYDPQTFRFGPRLRSLHVHQVALGIVLQGAILSVLLFAATLAVQVTGFVVFPAFLLLSYCCLLVGRQFELLGLYWVFFCTTPSLLLALFAAAGLLLFEALTILDAWGLAETVGFYENYFSQGDGIGRIVVAVFYLLSSGWQLLFVYFVREDYRYVRDHVIRPKGSEGVEEREEEREREEVNVHSPHLFAPSARSVEIRIPQPPPSFHSVCSTDSYEATG
ncbi:hypothetical protein M3Y99_01798900 [Aphelenchoides fujianensis]|nr:hypothetical protein M3Y99_01798900 [Aphelenchoides fujianensis]